jgi:DNA-binding transcriptional LysR family regulator
MSRLTEMEAFATVVEEGGFTDAARKMGISKSAVSKHVSALETRLGARLLSRTTRSVNPTEIGLAYYDRAARILNDAGEADALVAELHATPSGSLQVSAPSDLGAHVVSPLLGPFLDAYPDIAVNLELGHQDVDLMGEGFDLAIRIGEQKDSSLRARKLCEVEYRLVASPHYLAQHGVPRQISDLLDHKLLQSSNRPGRGVWKLPAPDGNKVRFSASGGLSVNDGKILLQAAISGMGIAWVPDFLYAKALRQGNITHVLPSMPVERQNVYVVYPPGRFTQPKTRAFIDFLVSRRICDLRLAS